MHPSFLVPDLSPLSLFSPPPAAAEKEARKTEGTFGWHWSSIQLDNGVDLSSTYLWKVATKETVDKVHALAPVF
jgi:hypothetical protein